MAALCATATWGMTGVFVRWLPGWSPFLVMVGRFLVAMIVMLPILLLTPGIRNNLTRSLATPLIWGLSLPAIGAYLFGTTAFQMAPVGEVTLLCTTSPLFVIAYKYVVRSLIKRSESFGMLLATVGVSLIMFPQLSIDQTPSWQAIAGYLLALGAAGLLALYAYWFNALAKQDIAPKSIVVVFVTFFLGSMLSLLCAVLFSNLAIGTGMSGQVALLFSSLGILSTAVPLLCYTAAVQRLPVMLSTAIMLLEPIFSVLFAFVALQEIPSLWSGIGSLFVFGGLLSIAREGN
jgi:drug/metabolite transporter (DMT)-like permease